MPNIDGGHYFYTGLFPIELEPVARPDGSVTVPSHLLREALASLPNFSQVREADDAARRTDRISPFARCRSTHFARLAVIDDPAFNGRDPVDAIKGAIKKVDLLVHQPVDHLSRAWLLFAADFDGADAGARDRWAAGLCQVMEPELRAIFRHCTGFDQVGDAQAFADYVRRGQLETTMSFNDYWIDPMPGRSLSLAMIGLAVVVVLAAFLGLAWFAEREWGGGWPVWVVGGLLGLGTGLWAAYKLVMARGSKPFATAPDSDLKSVLKSLFVQQHFTRFAIAQQGASAEQLHDAFERFLAETRPEDVDRPTQPPGVLHS
jgi:hypothetical protein